METKLVKKNKKIIINHLYSKALNLYGDRGNIIALCFRMDKRDIPYEVVYTELGDEKFTKADIYFMGGGQDREQMLVFEHLLKNKQVIYEEFLKGKIFLLICGGYQLFGSHFITGQGQLIEGLNIIKIETRAMSDKVSKRCIGNVVVRLSDEFIKYWNIKCDDFSYYLVGFENHSGQTYFTTDESREIGQVVHGYGNNYFSKKEGYWERNLIGTYLHGSLLPKNPHLADVLIKKALEVDEISKLDDSLELKAHYYILHKYAKINTTKIQ